MPLLPSAAGQLEREAGHLLGAGPRDHLRREASLALVDEPRLRPDQPGGEEVGGVAHDPDVGILEVLPHDDVVDALG